MGDDKDHKTDRKKLQGIGYYRFNAAKHRDTLNFMKGTVTPLKKDSMLVPLLLEYLFTDRLM